MWTLLLLTLAAAFAAPPESLIQPGEVVPDRAIWLDSNKRAVKIPFRMETRWLWRRTKDAPVDSPVRRTWIEVPPPYNFVRAWALNSKVDRVAHDAPFDAVAGASIFAVELQVAREEFLVFLEDEEGTRKQYSLVIQPGAGEAVRWIDDECAAQDITYEGQPDDASVMVAAFSCTRVGEEFELYVHRQRDASTSSNLPGKQAETGTWSRFRLKRPQSSAKIARPLGEIQIRAPGAKTYGRYLLSHQPRLTQVLRADLGASIAYASFSDGGATDVGQLGLVASAGFDYPLIARAFGLGARGMFTVLPLGISAQPANASTARYWSLDAHFGYLLDTPALDWDFQAGWYLWGMMVQDSAYGVSSLNGPLAQVRLAHQRLGSRGYFAYVRTAPTLREIALGGGIQVSSPALPDPLYLTFDLSDLSFGVSTVRSFAVGLRQPL